jgi:hypothetical protein
MPTPRRWKLELVVLTTVAALVMPMRAYAQEPTEGQEGEAAPKTEPYSLQAEDPDRPKDKQDPALVDATTGKKAKPKPPPIYTKWQFWAVAGGVLVGAIVLTWASFKIVDQIRGGDPTSCPPGYICAGEGR